MKTQTLRLKSQEYISDCQLINQLILDKVHDMVSIHRIPDLSCLYFNTTTLLLLGYSDKEMLGRNPLYWIHPDDLDRVMLKIRKNHSYGAMYDEYRLRKKDGTYLWFEAKGTFVRLDNGEMALVTIARDITLRRSLEEKLHLSELRYRKVVEDQTELIGRCNPDTTMTFVNNALCRVYGQEAETLIGKPLLTLVPSDRHNDILKFFKTFTPDNPVQNFINPVDGPDDVTTWYEWTTRAIFDGDGNIIEYQGVARDISKHIKVETELGKTCSELDQLINQRTAELIQSNRELTEIMVKQQQTEMALRESEDYYRTLFENVAAPTVLVNKDYKVIMANAQFMRMTGLTVDEIIGKKPFDFILPEDLAKVQENFRLHQTYPDQEPSSYDFRIVNKNGEIRVCQVFSSLMRESGHVILSILDITDQVEAKTYIQASEERFRRLFEQAPIGIVINRNGRIVLCNEAYRTMFGISNTILTDSHVMNQIAPVCHEEIKQILKIRPTGDVAPYSFESMGIRTDGSTFPIQVHIKNIELPEGPANITYVVDITDRERARELNKRYALLSTNSRDIILYVRQKDGQILEANTAAEREYGYERDELLAKTIFDLRKMDKPDLINKQMHQASTEGILFVTNHIRKDGSSFAVEVSSRGAKLNGEQVLLSIARNINERVRVENMIQRQMEAQVLVLEISKKFNNSVADGINEMIDCSLQMIGKFSCSDHCYLFLLTEDDKHMSNTNEWCANGIEPQIAKWQNLPIEIFPWWMNKLLSGETIFISCVDDMVTEAAAEKEILRAQGINSLIASPLFNDGKLIGFLGFDAMKMGKAWSNEDQYVMDHTAQIISKAIQRKRIRAALKESENYWRTIFNNNGVPAIIINEDMTILKANQEWGNLLGYNAQEIIGHEWIELVDKSMIDTMVEYHKMRRDNEESAPRIYMTRLKDNSNKIREGLIYVSMIPDTKKSTATFIDLTDYKRLDRTLKGICAGNSSMLKADNEEDLLKGICDSIVAVGGYDMAWIGYLQDDPMKKIKPVAEGGKHHGYIHKLNLALKDPKRAHGPSCKAIFTKNPVVIQELKKDDSFSPWLRDALRRGFKSTMSIPLMANNKAFGVLGIYSSSIDAFGKEEQLMLVEMANNLAYAIKALRTRCERDYSAQQLKASLNKMERILMQAVNSLGRTLEIRDPYTAGHQKRVTRLAMAIANGMDIPKTRINGIEIAGNLHDIGKIIVPTEILSKPGRINDMEWGIIKNHCQAGYDIVKDIEFPWPIGDILLQHHERIDGSGYPHGLKGDEILLEARILAVADVVEAMSSHRPYRPALGIDLALEEIEKNQGVLYDKDVVEACIRLFREKRFEF